MCSTSLLLHADHLLAEKNLKVFICTKDIQNSTDWLDVIITKLEKAKLAVVLGTKSYGTIGRDVRPLTAVAVHVNDLAGPSNFKSVFKALRP